MIRQNRFTSLFHKVIDFLEEYQIEYVLIGGVAVDIWGLPRKTIDIDIVLQLNPDHYGEFLRKAKQAGFKGDYKKIRTQLKKMGMCRLVYQQRHADFIMGYSEFEAEIFSHKRKVLLFGRNVHIASPEDIILYKLLAAREIDLADIKNIITTQGKNLDRVYLRSRARIMRNELRRPDIIDNLKKYLKEES